MMNVILLEKLGRLGNLGDQVAVRAGYARNYLVPKGKAVRATAQNIAKFEERRAELEKHAAENLKAAQKRAESLQGLTVVVAARAADEIKLYGSVGTHEIVDAIVHMKSDVHKSEIRLPNGPLRELGEHEIVIHLHTDVDVKIKVNVVAEK